MPCEQNRGNFILVLEGLFLLLAPCLEHQPCGQELDSENLKPLREAEDRDRLVPMHILNGLFDDLPGPVIAVKIADGIVVYRVAEEFGLYPARANGHDSDAALTQLDPESF